jgi:hypothetical protein
MTQHQPTARRRVALALALAAAVCLLAGCGGTDRRTGVVEEWGSMPPEKQDELLLAISDQKQMGYQVEAMTSREDAQAMCHEICQRVARSCKAAETVCGLSAEFSDVAYASAQCTVSRDRCKAHGAKVPRECACDLKDQ